MASPTVDFSTIYHESRKIMKAHSRHFLALSVLFLLPISFSLTSLPILQLSISKSDTKHTETLLRYTPQYQNIGLKTLLFFLLYTFLALTLSICASGTITYSVHHGFFGRPVKFISALKSLLGSLLGMFVTVFCALGIVVTMFVLGFLVFSGGIKGFQVSDGFGCVIGLVGLGLGFGVLLYLVVNWVLACVVVVVELSWGYAPLRRSAVLVKESRGVGVSLVLFYGGFMGLMVWASFGLKLGSGVWGEVLFVVQTVLLSSCLTGLLLHSMASVTVFYMYCKALHGELAFEIAEEFSREYVSLPFDEEKVPHLVSFVHPTSV